MKQTPKEFKIGMEVKPPAEVYDENIIYENLKEVSRTTKQPKHAVESGFYKVVGKMVKGVPVYDDEQPTAAPVTPVSSTPAPAPTAPPAEPAKALSGTVTLEPGPGLLQALGAFQQLLESLKELAKTLGTPTDRVLQESQQYRDTVAALTQQNASLQSRVEELQQHAKDQAIELTISTIKTT